MLVHMHWSPPTDACILGFHNCHPSAICDWNMDTQQVTCTCAPGYIGDGVTCNQVCETELNSCHDNATCQWAGTGQQVTCTCSAGFVGDGVVCEPCQSLCSAGMRCVMDTVSYCTCIDGYVLQGEECVQSEYAVPPHEYCSTVASLPVCTAQISTKCKVA